MGDFFGGLRSGIQFPQVVMNQGPLPGSGGLPAPLHDTADARINYGSSLLGDLTPYAYGEPGYLSSQNAYLNIPHKIQKIVPVVFLPEAKRPAKDIVDVSHPIDDGDIAFVLRLDRKSMFCTGLKNGDMKRAGLGTAIDPFINLCTLNYILSGMQLGVTNEPENLWTELLSNLDKARFGRQSGAGRDYGNDPINLGDIIHVVRHCIKPFGVTRGSEKQGGQDEGTLSAATWPVSFVVSLTIDGKESNVLNIWHHHELHAGNDLVLRLKPMPVRPYTLNHYYKAVKRQAWDAQVVAQAGAPFVWQLVPDLLDLDYPPQAQRDAAARILEQMPNALTGLRMLANPIPGGDQRDRRVRITGNCSWQELGYWHIGRSQIQTGKYGMEEYWHNDLANSLRTNHLDITFQPIFQSVPLIRGTDPADFEERRIAAEPAEIAPRAWQPSLGLERLSQRQARPKPPRAAAGPPVAEAQQQEVEPDWLGRLDFSSSAAEDDEAAPPSALGLLTSADKPAAVEAPASEPLLDQGGNKKRPTKRGRSLVGGSLLKADGTSEPSTASML
jgi:hypothetical protein